MEKLHTCCFTGHRTIKLPWRGNEDDERCKALKNLIYDAAEAVYHGGIRHYICGMATGCDTYFCEAVIALRDEHEDITLEAAIPCQEQASRWSDIDVKRYNRLLDRCDVITIVSDYYSPGCMMKRNQYMVDNSSVLIAAYNGSSGGTQNTLLYAMRNGVEVIQLPVD